MTPGRTRSADLTRRVLEETIVQLRERGYASLNIEAIAAAANTSKTAIYRRWPSRAELTISAILSELDPTEQALTGSVEADLLAFAGQNAKSQSAIRISGVQANVWTSILSADVLPLYLERYGDNRRNFGRSIVKEGIANGELPRDVDGELLLDMLAGVVMFKNALQHRGVSRWQLEQTIRTICSSPPRLESAAD